MLKVFSKLFFFTFIGLTSLTLTSISHGVIVSASLHKRILSDGTGHDLLTFSNVNIPSELDDEQISLISAAIMTLKGPSERINIFIEKSWEDFARQDAAPSDYPFSLLHKFMRKENLHRLSRAEFLFENNDLPIMTTLADLSYQWVAPTLSFGPNLAPSFLNESDLGAKIEWKVILRCAEVRNQGAIKIEKKFPGMTLRNLIAEIQASTQENLSAELIDAFKATTDNNERKNAFELAVNDLVERRKDEINSFEEKLIAFFSNLEMPLGEAFSYNPAGATHFFLTAIPFLNRRLLPLEIFRSFLQGSTTTIVLRKFAGPDLESLMLAAGYKEITRAGTDKQRPDSTADEIQIAKETNICLNKILKNAFTHFEHTQQ